MLVLFQDRHDEQEASQQCFQSGCGVDRFQDRDDEQKARQKLACEAGMQGNKKRSTVSDVNPRLAPEALVGTLGVIPADDWWRNWAVGRTMILRRTSKTVKNTVDKL